MSFTALNVHGELSTNLLTCLKLVKIGDYSTNLSLDSVTKVVFYLYNNRDNFLARIP